MFAGVTLMVIVTTFMAPPLLKRLLSERSAARVSTGSEGIEELVTEA
jgi:hypothetical protein